MWVVAGLFGSMLDILDNVLVDVLADIDGACTGAGATEGGVDARGMAVAVAGVGGTLGDG